jgi:hypothetical protein
MRTTIKDSDEYKERQVTVKARLYLDKVGGEFIEESSNGICMFGTDHYKHKVIVNNILLGIQKELEKRAAKTETKIIGYYMSVDGDKITYSFSLK